MVPGSEQGRPADGSGSRWSVVPAGPDDYPVFAGLFEESFGYPMPEDQWRWKYVEGRGQGLFVYGDSGPVAHYGGLTRRALFHGQPVHTLQPVDVLVTPRERGVLTRRGPMFLAATALLEAEMGYGRRHLLGFGFPTARHLRLAQTLGLFEPGCRIMECAWTALVPKYGSRWAAIDITQAVGDRARGLVDTAWQAMAADLGDWIVNVRDAAWVEYRYLRHPRHAYRVMAVRHRLWRTLMGVVVVRVEDDHCEIMDLIGARRSLPTLVGVARLLAGQWGVREVSGWFAERFVPWFGDTGAEVRPLDVRNVVFTWTQTPPAEQTRDAWWLSSGDTDFR